jgi:chromatin remodeling complex protein RSC6
MSKITKTSSKTAIATASVESAPIVDKKTKTTKTSKTVESVAAKTVAAKTVAAKTSKVVATKTATTKTAATKTAATKTATTKTATTKTAETDETEVTEVSVETTQVIDPVNAVIALSTDFLAKLNQLSGVITALKSEYRTIEKKMVRELKLAQKNGAKRKRKTGNRAPSGFVKPTLISDELANFLEKPSGTEMARTDVTREINKYIRAHDLQDKSNGRKINPDIKLSSLLKLNDTDELTYFNLQKYMSIHFQKSAAALALLDAATNVTTSV